MSTFCLPHFGRQKVDPYISKMKSFIFLFFIFFISIKTVFPQNSIKRNYLIEDPFKEMQKLKGKKIPLLSIQMLNDKAIKGKIVVINLWATTCHPCLEEIPLLNELVDKFKREDILFYAISPEDSTKINLILEKNSFKYTIIANAQEIFTKLGLVGYPYNIIIDQRGIIRYISTGTVDIQGRKIAAYELPLAITEILKKN